MRCHCKVSKRLGRKHACMKCNCRVAVLWLHCKACVWYSAVVVVEWPLALFAKEQQLISRQCNTVLADCAVPIFVVGPMPRTLCTRTPSRRATCSSTEYRSCPRSLMLSKAGSQEGRIPALIATFCAEQHSKHNWEAPVYMHMAYSTKNTAATSHQHDSTRC